MPSRVRLLVFYLNICGHRDFDMFGEIRRGDSNCPKTDNRGNVRTCWSPAEVILFSEVKKNK